MLYKGMIVENRVYFDGLRLEPFCKRWAKFLSNASIIILNFLLKFSLFAA